MLQHPPGQPYLEPNTTVKGQKLQAVDNFTHMGSTLSRKSTIDAEVVSNRIAKASSAFGRIRQNAWERRGISLQ